jgi:hypothetical protein
MYLFGAFTPADGEALTAPYAGRTTANWEVVYQPTYAPYLNLIQPWWKGLRSPSRGGVLRHGLKSVRPQRGAPAGNRASH